MEYKALYYALENQYKKTKGDKSFTEYVAQWLGKQVAKTAAEYGKNCYDTGIKGAEFKNGAEFILDNVYDALISESYVEDKLRDAAGYVIERNTKAILAAHPEMLESDEKFYFED